MSLSTPTMLEPHTPIHLETAPHVITRGEGVKVWDSEGNSFHVRDCRIRSQP
jgi:4-aminobutyrate--pyruvate transaminase